MMRGSIVRVNLEDQDPPEFGKTRPGIVLSHSLYNETLPTLVVIPLSTRPPEIWPLRYQVPETPGLKSSYAVIPGIRQVSRKRIIEEIGQVPASFMKDLLEAVNAYLGD